MACIQGAIVAENRQSWSHSSNEDLFCQKTTILICFEQWARLPPTKCQINQQRSHRTKAFISPSQINICTFTQLVSLIFTGESWPLMDWCGYLQSHLWLTHNQQAHDLRLWVKWWAPPSWKSQRRLYNGLPTAWQCRPQYPVLPTMPSAVSILWEWKEGEVFQLIAALSAKFHSEPERDSA